MVVLEKDSEGTVLSTKMTCSRIDSRSTKNKKFTVDDLTSDLT